MLTFLAVVAVFSVLIIVHEVGHMLVAKRLGVRVEKFSLGFGKRLVSIKRGGTEYSLSLFPFGGYVKLAGDNPLERKGSKDEFLSKGPLTRFLIIVAGAFTNHVFAFLLFFVIFLVGVPTFTTRVNELVPDFPAVTSGIEKGDLIVEIDGKAVSHWDDLVGIVQKSTDGRVLLFKVERGDAILEFNIAPRVVSVRNVFGQEIRMGFIGISPQREILFIKHGFFEAIALGAKKLVTLVATTYKMLWFLVTGGLPVKQSITGPIGIAIMIGDATRVGFLYLLDIMARISVALAVFNLLPFPILDGGHVLFLAIEKLRGKPVSVRIQETVSQIALYLLIAFAIFVSWNDIVRFFFK